MANKKSFRQQDSTVQPTTPTNSEYSQYTYRKLLGGSRWVWPPLSMDSTPKKRRVNLSMWAKAP